MEIPVAGRQKIAANGKPARLMSPQLPASTVQSGWKKSTRPSTRVSLRAAPSASWSQNRIHESTLSLRTSTYGTNQSRKLASTVVRRLRVQ
jgi:hypothetical protein